MFMKKTLSKLSSTLQEGLKGGILFLALIVSTSVIYASNTKVDGIWYDFDSSTLTASVTYQGSAYNSYTGEYSGSVVIPKTVTYNGTTYSVTSIGDYAFAECSSLTSITIPNSVTSIGDDAFYYCSKLTSITIPNSVTSIGGDAFYYCSKLTSITIPNSVTNIGYRAFLYCSSLTSITIPNSVTSIGYDAFYNCYSLTKTNYTGDVASWCKIKFGSRSANPISESNKFYINGEKITELVIPNSVTSIGEYAFFWCSSLTSITCEAETPPTVGSSAFDRVSPSIPVYVPCGCVGAYEAAYGWEAFTNIQEPLAEYLIEVNVNDTIMGSAKVDYNTFCEGAQISATANYGYHFVQWSDSVTENPRTLVLTQDTTLTAEFAPNQYSIITNSKDPERGTTQGDTTVNYLENVTISATANYGYHFTQWNDGDTTNPRQVQVTGDITYTATFEKNTYSISLSCNEEQGAVESVSAAYLDTVTISATPNVGYHFVEWNDGNTDNPRTLVLTQDTTLIAEFAQSFSGQCGDNLYWELIDTTLHITGSGEMYNYKPDTAPWKLLVNSIKVLTIAEDVTKIGYDAFDGCSALESVVWNAKNYTNPANAEAAPFYGITSHIKSFTFGAAVEHIPAYLCDGMEKLTSITTPNSLNTIGTSAFEGCIRLSKISLGTGLEEIAANAFAGCTRLYDIYVYATYPPFADESSFANYNVYVYVPCEYQRGYTLDVVWGKFKFIKCIESEDATTDGNVTVDPGFNDVTITWPKENNADNYTIVIEKDGKVFCTLTFNAAGQLLNIAFAPSRDGSSRPVQYAEQAVNGYRFTVTGLDEGSAYIYELVIKDNGDNVLQTYSGEFRTQSIADRTVTVKYDTMQGAVIGAGTYLLGDTATLTVIPNEGYQFVAWGDGCTDNPRYLVVTQDTTLTVVFEVLTYNVTVTCDPIQGSITGSGTYNHGDGVTLTAIPNEGYQFVRWSNDVVDNPYTFVISEDITLTAEFEEVIYNSVENTTANTSTAQKLLRDGQLLIIRAGKTYDAMGQEL